MVISNKKMEDIMKKVKSLKDFGSSRKSVSETIENKTRE